MENGGTSAFGVWSRLGKPYRVDLKVFTMYRPYGIVMVMDIRRVTLNLY